MPGRDERVTRSVRAWSDQLGELGGRNTLLWHRDPGVSTLDLTYAHPSGLAMLLAGRPTRLSGLVREPGALVDARKRARSIWAKTVELAQERGIAAGWLAVGMATWDAPNAPWPPCAPVLLRACELRPRAAGGDDFDVDLGVQTEVNPALVHHLATEHDLHLDAELLADLALTNDRFDPAPVLRHVTRSCASVPGFGIEPRLVIGTFSGAGLSMVNDLHDQTGRLAGHDVVAALAGDPGALAAVAARPGVATRAAELDPATEPDPATEHLVLDADSAQAAVVTAVLAGSHLVVKGPPGTGTSQTIANLIAALAGAGQRTLFVAQKRAAIDAVLGRLASVGLGDLVLDLHDGGTGRRRVAREVAVTMERAGQVARPAAGEPAAALTARRDRLLAHKHALHSVREPWGVTAYAAQSALADLTSRRPAPRSRVRVRGAGLERLDQAELGLLRDELRAAASAGALSVGPDDDPWFGARLTTADETHRALTAVTALSEVTLPLARERMGALLAEAGMPPARTVADWGRTLALIGGVRQSLEVFSPNVFDASPGELAAATGDSGWRDDHGVTMGLLQRRRLRSAARALLRPGTPPPDLHAALAAAHDQRGQWQQAAGPGSRPALPGGLSETERAYLDVAEPLTWLSQRLVDTAAGGGLLDVDLDVLAGRLALLGELAATLPVVPHTVALRDRLLEAGLEPLLTDLAQRSVGPQDVGAELDLVWWTSVLEHVARTDPAYGGHDGGLLRQVAAEFADADRQQLVAAAERVRRVSAERLATAIDQHPEQAALLRAEAGRTRRHRPVRELVGGCPDVLAAATPCWAMSPLVVPAVLPPGELFDVVVFDEASQVALAEAVPAISRGRQVVVVGDDRQLWPTAFSATATPDDAQPPSTVAREGPGSVLEVLSAVLPVAHLHRHYRSVDERLVEFANRQVYDGGLVTLPGTVGDDVLTLEEVDGTGPVIAGADGVESADAEVTRVVDVVLEHARGRPDESLGVVTLGRRHAARIDDALRRALAADPDVAAFFAADGAGRFFVKDAERVQGDERDAIVLSVGFGRTPHGRVLHRFGALSAAGGERLLNVAITRARRRMTVVCSFGAADLDPAKLHAVGPRMLREFLAYAASGGELESVLQSVDRPGEQAVVRDPLLDDLTARLRSEGLTVVQRRGASSAPIDLAVGVDDDRLLLAVEGDGPAYAAEPTVRERDRLRVEQLQRLGWTHLRVWSTDVFRDPAREVARVRAAVRAVERSEEVRVSQDRTVRGAAVAEVDWDAGQGAADSASEGTPAVADDIAVGATGAGWGEVVDAGRDRAERERWLVDERPPHWD